MRLNHGSVSQERLFKILFSFLAALLLIQFFFNRSLWNDEAMLALNILYRNYTGLLKPLDYHQIAPVLFLFIERTATVFLGKSELALRLFPLLGGLISLPLFYRLCLQWSGNRIVALAAMFLVGSSPSFLYYSTEVKQYGVDLFVLILIYYCAFYENEFLNKRRTVILSLVGIFAVFVSNVSVIGLFTAGSVVLFSDIRQKRLSIRVIVPLLIWMLCFGLNYFLFISNHPYTQFMQDYWHDSFMPVHSPKQLIQWIPRKISQVFFELLPSSDLGKKFYLVTICLYLFGLVQLYIRKKFLMLYLCVFPVLIHLILSALRIYPYDLRLIYYQLSLFIAVISFGSYQLFSIIFKNKNYRHAAVATVVVACSSVLFKQYPLKREEIKPVINQLKKEAKPGETIYVFYGSVPAFLYYQLTGLAKFDSVQVVLGKVRTDDPRHYLTDLGNLHGRTWFLFSHVVPYLQRERMLRDFSAEISQSGVPQKSIQAYECRAFLFNMKN